MGSILQFIETGRRLNILAPDIESFFDSDLLETFGYSAWFVCLRGNQFGFSPTSQTALEVETLSYPHLSQSDTQELREAWQREYVEQFFQLAPPPAQKKQMTNFETRLGEGTHVLYRSDSSNIVGHACWAEDQHALLNLKCVYFHQWIRKDTDASIRKEIHKHFFSTLLGQPYPAMSGIAAHNSKALHHFRNNGFSFPILSIRKETGDLNVC